MDVAGSSVAAMVVGTVFIMIFGMATVSLVENIDQSIKNADYELPDPEVTIFSVFDQQEATGPGAAVTFGGVADEGTGYNGFSGTCPADGGTGTGMTLTIAVAGDVISGATIANPGSGYAAGDTLTVNCSGNSPGDPGNNANVTVSAIHGLNTISIKNLGTETVELSHVILTYSKQGEKQGTPFNFTSIYSGNNTFLFPGETVLSDPFALDPITHGFNLEDDPDRLFLAIFEHTSAKSVIIS